MCLGHPVSRQHWHHSVGGASLSSAISMLISSAPRLPVASADAAVALLVPTEPRNDHPFDPSP